MSLVNLCFTGVDVVGLPVITPLLGGLFSLSPITKTLKLQNATLIMQRTSLSMVVYMSIVIEMLEKWPFRALRDEIMSGDGRGSCLPHVRFHSAFAHGLRHCACAAVAARFTRQLGGQSGVANDSLVTNVTPYSFEIDSAVLPVLDGKVTFRVRPPARSPAAAMEPMAPGATP